MIDRVEIKPVSLHVKGALLDKVTGYLDINNLPEEWDFRRQGFSRYGQGPKRHTTLLRNTSNGVELYFIQNLLHRISYNPPKLLFNTPSGLHPITTQLEYEASLKILKDCVLEICNGTWSFTYTYLEIFSQIQISFSTFENMLTDIRDPYGRKKCHYSGESFSFGSKKQANARHFQVYDKRREFNRKARKGQPKIPGELTRAELALKGGKLNEEFDAQPLRHLNLVQARKVFIGHISHMDASCQIAPDKISDPARMILLLRDPENGLPRKEVERLVSSFLAGKGTSTVRRIRKEANHHNGKIVHHSLRDLLISGLPTEEQIRAK